MDGFALISDPTRRRILDTLRGEDATVGQLSDLLNVPQPLVSKHLRVLREANAVSAQVVGNRRIYRLTADPLPDVLAWVHPYHQMWSKSFDQLSQALERKETQ